MLATSFRFLALSTASALALSGVGCFSRSPGVTPEDSAKYRSEAEHHVLANAASRWGFRRPRRREKRADYSDGFYIHVGGSTECGGFLRERQSTHVYAWVTEGSPTGDRVNVKILNTGFNYNQGFFEGTGVSRGASGKALVEAHDTISGPRGEICQCVNVFASAKLKGRIFLRTGDKLCPSS